MDKISDTADEVSFKTVTRLNIKWMKMKVLWVFLSLALLAFSFSGLWIKGINFGIDFQGGTSIEIASEKEMDIGILRNALEESFSGVNVQGFGDKGALIRIENNPEFGDSQQIVQKVQAELTEAYPAPVTYQKIESVGPKVGESLVETSVWAILASVTAMLIYVWFRFELPFGIGAIVALSHDVIITLGIFAWFQLVFDLSTIAALLTIIGYSMNDTVVIYDRIRENMRKYRKAKLADLIDLSVNETMARTIVTTLTLILALVALLFFGGPVLRSFIIAMTCGVVIGTYSTVFIASPVLIWLGLKPETALKEVSKLEAKKEA